MLSWKIEVESMTNLTINILVRLATVVYVLIQYPHKKITITKSLVQRGSCRELLLMSVNSSSSAAAQMLAKVGAESAR
jgi:hypothetical protein